MTVVQQNIQIILMTVSFILAAVACTSISKPQELEKAVAEIGDWEALCEYLGVDRATLSDLRHTENTKKKRRCLQAYIDTDKACWEQVVKIVADYPFNNARIANKIAHDYLHAWCRLC